MNPAKSKNEENMQRNLSPEASPEAKRKSIKLRKFAKPKTTNQEPLETTVSPPQVNLPNEDQESTENLENPDKDAKLQELLNEIYKYKNNPASYSASLQKFIDKNYSLSLHKQRRKKFKRRPFIVYDPYESIQADLVFYTQFSHQNFGYKYILTVIDIFSKMAHCRALKTKRATEVAEKLDEILAEFPIIPRKLMVDAGTEFSGTSPAINDIIVKKYKMVIYVLTGTTIKASIIERFNRTLRERLARYMTENNTKKWIDVLQDIVQNYNSTFHRSIGMAPSNVTFENRNEVFKKLYPKMDQKVKCKVKVGWRVRIPRQKPLFEKGFTPNWSTEVYIIKKIHKVFYLLRQIQSS